MYMHGNKAFMNKSIYLFLIYLSCSICFGLLAQADYQTITLANPSFEGEPHRGTFYDNDMPTEIKGWYDCGTLIFKGQNPPDIHPNNFWKNNNQAADGQTYLGMVTRDNGTHEFLSQRLTQPLRKGKCYAFDVKLSQSGNYWSTTQEIIKESVKNGLQEYETVNYVRPCVLRVWLGSSFCTKKQLIAESAPVNHEQWKNYHFEFSPKLNTNYIIIEVYYKTPLLTPYNGHILVDNLTDIQEIPCPGEEPVLVAVEEPKKPKKSIPAHKRRKKPKKSVETAPVVSNVDSQPKILKELDKKTIKKGQVIRIKKLFFDANASEIEEESYPVLNELYAFMISNEDITIEVGGHTNGIPKHEFCDQLSNDRAKAVASFLVSRGISANRVLYKGYGKRKPVASNKTKIGRQKNQRVEIKILSLG